MQLEKDQSFYPFYFVRTVSFASFNFLENNHKVLITFIKVTVCYWFHFQCILCWLIVFQQFYFTQLPFISNQETSVEFNSNWISKCICSSSMAWIELPNLNSFSYVLCKVQILWEGHKIWKNLPAFFERTRSSWPQVGVILADFWGFQIFPKN